nr:D-alanyl-D-alanine carboxypeptidase family protein [Clostridium acetireducens]
MLSFNTIAFAKNDLNVDAKCAIALDANTLIPLYEKNSDMIVPMASTTKIMTALVAIKYGDLDKKVEISSKASSVRGSTAGYKKGEKITIKELLYGLMLRSGNDAAIALAEGISGSVDEFMKIMNEYAISIGILNSHFESPHGLDSENHYSTAYDLAVATAKAKENILFNEIVSAKDVDGDSYGFTRSYHNINKILWQIPESNGVKTGYTGKAGKCLVSSINHNGRDIIIVVLNSTPRWKETKKIYDYVLKNYEYKKFFSKEEIIDKVNLGKQTLNIKCNEDVIIPVSSKNEYKVEINKPKSIDFSVNKNDKIGMINIYCNHKKIYSNKLNAANSIKTKIFFKKINIFS